MKSEGFSFVAVSRSRLLAAVFLSVLLTSCGSHGTQTTSGPTPGTGSVSFSAVWESPPEGAFRLLNLPSGGVQGSAIRPRALAGDVCTDYSVDWVYLEVWSGSNKVAGDRFECSRHTGNLLNVPAGDNLSFQVYATVTGSTNPFWRMQENITFSLTPGEEKQFNGIVMGYVGPTTAPPEVTSFTPENNATGIPATTVVRFQLSKPMVERTVTDNDAVILVDGNSARIPGRTVYDNASWSAVYFPSTRLAAGMRHTVTLSTSMTDRATQGLVSPVSWNFTVYEPGGWRSPLLLEVNDNRAVDPQLAMNGSGNAVVVWQQSDGTRDHISANRYTPSGGWGTATLIETDNTGGAFSPQVAMDGSGNAVAVWTQSDGTRYNIWANRYTPSGGWGTAALIETDNAGSATLSQVAMDGSGNAIAVWQQSDGTRNNIWANRYTPSGGWGTATLIETGNGDATSPQVVMDGSGNAVAVWYQSDGTRNNIWANRYTPSGGWGAAALIETGNGDATSPQVAIDGSGNAVAVWTQSDGTRNNIWANRYTPSGGWGTAALIETDDAGSAFIPQVAMDGSGNAVAVWTQSDGTRGNIWANRYTPSGGWGTATLIETDNTGYASDPQVAMDGSGNAVAVWTRSVGIRDKIWENRYTPSGGWGTAALIGTDDAEDAMYPQVAMDGSGNAVAVWTQSDGTRDNIWANRYTPSGEWETATLIETNDAGSALIPQVAMDGSGNAVAVWHQYDGTRDNIWANRYTPSGGWGTAALIETNNAGDAMYPQVAMDGSGNAVAVWHQSDGTRNNIWANRYTPSGGWGTAALIETDDAGSALIPQVAMDGSGNAVVVWAQFDGTRGNIWANRYTPAGGWGTAALIETDNAGNAVYPQVAVDGSGNAVAVWYQSDGTRYNIWANRYTPSGGWGTAALIETDNAGDAVSPQVAMDGSGNAVAVWYQSDGTRDNIWANWYTPAGGWGTAALIETDNAGSALIPQVAMDGSGNAVAVWYQSDGTRYNIWANRYTPSGGWGTAALIETDNAGDAVSPQVAMDGSGNAVAVWYQSDGTRNNIWANRYTPAGGWGTATLIETDNAGNALIPQVAMDGSGNAIAVWQQSDGTRTNIWANRYY